MLLHDTMLEQYALASLAIVAASKRVANQFR